MKKYNQSKLMSVPVLLVVIVLVVVLSLPVLNAQVETLGTFKKGDCVILKQICSNCTYNNITTVLYPNSSYSISNVQMTKVGTDYSYNLCNSTSAVGRYIVNGFGDLDGSIEVWSYDFYITTSGKDTSTAQAIIYLVLLTINLILFLLSLMGGIMINGQNESNPEGVVLVNYKKYLKMGFFFLSYILLIWFSFNLWNTSDNILSIDYMTNFFKATSTFLLSALLPVSLIFIIFIFVQLFIDKRFRDMFERGIPGYAY